MRIEKGMRMNTVLSLQERLDKARHWDRMGTIILLLQVRPDEGGHKNGTDTVLLF